MIGYMFIALGTIPIILSIYWYLFDDELESGECFLFSLIGVFMVVWGIMAIDQGWL